MTYAKVNRKMFRKYFPTNHVIFEDDVDYSKEHDVQKDENFKKFMDHWKVSINEEMRNRLRSGKTQRADSEIEEIRPREKTML